MLRRSLVEVDGMADLALKWSRYRKVLLGAYIYSRWAWADIFDLLLGRRMPTPPKHIRRRVGPFASPLLYRQTSKQTASYIKELCRLRPNERILDVGCGCGRVAGGLIRYLGRRGSYDGFDIDADLIRWCTEKIEPYHPNFHFQWADIMNDLYNPQGSFKASEFVFPYPDDSFDVVFAGSLFTHLLPPDAEHYLEEIRRVLKKKGRCLISYFLLNDESERLTEKGLSTLNFAFPVGPSRAADEQSPEAAIAYPEEYVLGLYQKNGLRRKGPIRYGSWCGRSRPFKWSNQDMILAVKD